MNKGTVAAVDIGTNSTRLLIAERDGRAITRELTRRTTITRLGLGLVRGGALDPRRVEKTIDVLSDYRRLIEESDVRTVAAVATSAMRDADGSAGVLARFTEALGAPVQIISGETEGTLTFDGALSDAGIQALGSTFFVIDIGGGSTEFAKGKAGDRPLTKSLPLGCVRLTDTYLNTDPPAAEGLAALAAQIKNRLRESFDPDYAGRSQPLAVAGTATSLVAIELGLDTYDRDRVHQYRLMKTSVASLLDRLATLNLVERRRIMGLEPKRAESIVAGAVILLETMDYFHFNHVIVSEKDILDGLALSKGTFLHV